ncbi:MAG: hypothetical protein PHD68_02190 [Rugosibacter sp.]|nr:hypothetical protein [Rugosibacter sp.]
MPQTVKNLNFDRIARSNDLYRIESTNTLLPGTTNLSKRARRYLFFLISLVRAGYCQISAPSAVLADAIYRAQGQTASIRTLRYALAELETAGYLVRRTCRLGKDRSTSIIDIRVERFVFWTKIKTAKVSPITPTQSYLSAYRQEMQPEELSKDHCRVNSLKHTDIDNKEPRAGARSKSSAKFVYHPIIYTLMCVITNSAEKTRMIGLAKREIEGAPNETGIDWAYWARLWPSLDVEPGGRREMTARKHIVPVLAASLKAPQSPPSSPAEVVPTTTSEPIAPASAEIVAALLAKLSLPLSRSPEAGIGLPPVVNEQQRAPDEMSLTQEELELLSRAKKSVENRR